MTRAPRAAVLALLALSACTPAFDQDQACRLAGAYVLLPEEENWQHLDSERYPPSGYRDIELLECTEFLSRREQGWARIRVHARGDEFDLEDERFLGRTIFSTEVEMERTPEGWKVINTKEF